METNNYKFNIYRHNISVLSFYHLDKGEPSQVGTCRSSNDSSEQRVRIKPGSQERHQTIRKLTFKVTITILVML